MMPGLFRCSYCPADTRLQGTLLGGCRALAFFFAALFTADHSTVGIIDFFVDVGPAEIEICADFGNHPALADNGDEHLLNALFQILLQVVLVFKLGAGQADAFIGFRLIQNLALGGGNRDMFGSHSLHTRADEIDDTADLFLGQSP